MIRAAIVGLGRWGQIMVESVQGKSETIQFTAGVTRTVSKAAAFMEQHAIPLGGDYAAVLADTDIDAIVLATPHTQHTEQIAQAAAAGKHVFVEKPFTLTAADAVAAVKAAEDANIVLSLGHNRRFMPSWTELKNRIDSGSLGTILHAETNFSGSGGLQYRPDGWRADRSESPAGGMGGMGIHMVDTLIGLFGQITEVHCVSVRRAVAIDVDDTTSMLLRFENGMTGYLGTFNATVHTQTVRVFGSKGSAEIRQERNFEFRPVEGEDEAIDFGPFDKERAELEAFAAGITDGAPYPLPAAEAIHGIEVFEAIIRSAETGETVSVG